MGQDRGENFRALYRDQIRPLIVVNPDEAIDTRIVPRWQMGISGLPSAL